MAPSFVLLSDTPFLSQGYCLLNLQSWVGGWNLEVIVHNSTQTLSINSIQ